ncbi:class I SAM-dependent DNA methyltransferase [Aquihabitans sp. McL0605]|uniref:class I SAM-dependent DNA methyltransferase n=1 Tax=Aquihabitans sp. McL0605 TaxID=3415671 RepID=UPI003CFA4BF9
MGADGIFDERVAPTYDADHAVRFAPEELEPTVAFLAGLAAGRRVLELAIGTGRVALPLRERGLDVAGIELSRAMVAELRAKPGGEAIPVAVGDMATTRADGSFGLVLLVFNAIGNLLTQEEQVACFANAAAHLDPGGHFVVEVGVPRLRRLPVGETLVPFDVSDGHVGIDEYDVVEQRLVSHHYRIGDGRAEVFRSLHRYVWPSELDLMATMAGLVRQERWSDWHRSPFTAESTQHVSVWQKPTA